MIQCFIAGGGFDILVKRNFFHKICLQNKIGVVSQLLKVEVILFHRIEFQFEVVSGFIYICIFDQLCWHLQLYLRYQGGFSIIAFNFVLFKILCIVSENILESKRLTLVLPTILSFKSKSDYRLIFVPTHRSAI